jgi:hypothetical protein
MTERRKKRRFNSEPHERLGEHCDDERKKTRLFRPILMAWSKYVVAIVISLWKPRYNNRSGRACCVQLWPLHLTL